MRFATLFGASLKMRCDLLLNDFVYKAVIDRNIVLFDANSVRTFLHVRDAIQAYLMIAERPDPFLGEVFNVGSRAMSFSKLDVARLIQKQVDVEVIQSGLADPDRRDLMLSFDKISALGFKPTITVEQGIAELVRLYQWYQPFSAYQTF